MSLKKYDIVLVDGSSYLFRAYHALPPLVNVEGVPTGAVFGVLNMIKKLQKDYSSAKIIVVFDPKGGTFRHEMYEGYKADRGTMPDDLAIQIPLVHEAIIALGLPLLIEPGYEADDVIASLVGMRQNQSVLISTLDKDLAQLVNDEVHIINTMHNKLLDPQGVVDKFGVRPSQIRDYLALVGDKSDSIPGITGVGPKTAAKWLNLYESLEGIKTHQKDITGKVGDNLRREIAQLDLSYQLVTLVDTLNVAEDIKDIKGQDVDTKRLQSIFSSLGFKRWYSELSQPDPVAFAVLQNLSGIDSVAPLLKKVDFSVLVPLTKKEHSVKSSISHFAFRFGEQCVVLDAEKVSITACLKKIFSLMHGKTIVCYDVKQILNYLSLEEISTEVAWFDIMLAGYVLDSSISATLEALSSRYLKNPMIVVKEDEPAEVLAKQSKNIQSIYPALQEAFVEKPKAQDIFREIEQPLMHVLHKMEQAGVLIDQEKLLSYATELKGIIRDIEAKAHHLAGEPFNLSSPKQIREVLFDKLSLPIIEKTPGGDPSTAESTLQALKDQHEIVPMLLQHRTLSKILSTYAESLVKQASDEGRIHGRFNQAVTITGRLSSANPNLQNIPIRTEAGRVIRSAFIAKPGYQIVSADYSQIELRIMAHFSEDIALQQAFQDGEDIHQATAARVAGVALQEVTEEMRRQAKAVNFGLIYGMSAFGLSKQLGIGRSEAQDLIDTYFEKYPGILAYMNQVREEAQETGTVSTLLGRALNMSGAQSKNAIQKQAALRAAINAPMQGTAADIIKLSMLLVNTHCKDFDYQMLIQVHDELVFEVKASQVDSFVEEVVRLMENVFTLKVPLVVNASSGNSWEEAH
ncbi:MAG: DNA polymerase I [Pseudomonadota bacterium]|nr:DNA polymerase I [Pseudomonadota bacterium]